MKKKTIFLLAIISIGLVGWWLKIIKPNLWSQDYQYNFALLSKKRVSITTIDPQKNTIFSVIFPKNLLVESFGNYGEVRVSKLNELALQENQGLLVSKSLEYFFGIPLDFWFFLEEEELADFEALGVGEGLAGVKEEVSNIIFSTQKMSLLDRINLWRVRSWLRKRHLITESKRGEEEFCEKEGDFYKLDEEKWDNWASVYLADPILKDEHLPIGIYNSSEIKGLAGRLARILTNSGLFVAVVRDSQLEGGSCLLGLKSSELKNSLTYRRLLGLIDDCEVKVLKEREFSDSTKINIYLKENFSKLR